MSRAKVSPRAKVTPCKSVPSCKGDAVQKFPRAKVTEARAKVAPTRF